MGRRLRGGHRFPRFRGEPQGEFGECPPPERAIVFLRGGIYIKSQTQRTEFQVELPPLVEPGDHVKTGAIIARDDQRISTPIHSPISGEVTALEQRTHPGGGKAQAAIIEADGKDEWELLPTVADPGGLEAEELQRLLYEAGVTDGGNSGFPTRFNSSPAEPDDIEYFIINAVDDEPYLRGNGALLAQDIGKFIAGAELMRRALGEVEVHLAIGKDSRGLMAQIKERAPHWLKVASLPPRYPQGDEEPLIRSILGMEVPPGGLSIDVGVVVQDVVHVLAASEAVHEGRPFISVPLAVGGPGASRPGIYKVRIGTPLSQILRAEDGSRVIIDGVLRGFPVEDLEAPISRRTRGTAALRGPTARLLAWSDPGFAQDSYTRAFLALPWLERRADFGLHGPERPCVKCGFCFDACPAGIAPAMIAEYAAHELFDEAESLNIFSCIECGLCAYVCPAKLPLLEGIRSGKRKIWEAKG